ncbi:MAG: TonB-dependent receptor, partial [Cellvibrionaceae bacterium]|nr:TonB-dependent receptor [Cellvibrionaceae bacterium]
EGFRPGFLNRPGGKVSKDGKYTVPFSFDTDDVTNYELGWKLDLMDGTLRINGDLFYVEVSDMQVGIFDPNITNLFFADNAADAEIKGLEADFIWAPEALPGLTISGAISLLDTEITDSFVTQFVQVGDELAFAPELQGNLQVRYEWDLANGYMAHVMAHTSYSDDAVTDIVVSNRTSIDSWSLHGLTAGVSSETWDAVLYADNISDERAQLSGNAIFNRDRINIARPRTVGVRFSYHF